MKVLLLVICNVFVAIGVNAQVKIRNQSLTDPEKNIIYAGVTNKIKIEGAPADTNYKIVCPETAIRYWFDKASEFSIRPGINDTGKTTLDVYRNVVLIATQKFSVKYIPDPQLWLGNNIKDWPGPEWENKSHSSDYSVGEVLQEPFLQVLYKEDCWFKVPWQILGFTATTSVKKQGTWSYAISGNKFSDELIEQIQTLKTGAKIYFEEIRAIGPDSILRRLVPHIITIK